MKVFIGFVIAVGVLLGIVLMSKDTTTTAKPTSMQTIQADVANGAQLIDVRTAEEYGQGHIVGAINLPVQGIQSGAMPAVAKDKPVYVYCQSGNRSSKAAAALKQAGYTNVIDLGAMENVQKIGGQITS